MPTERPLRHLSSSMRALLLLLVASVTTFVANRTAVAEGPEVVASAVISSDAASCVMALVEPWRDETEVAPGVRFMGAAIEQERACYILEGARTVRACLLPPVGARPLVASMQREIPGGATLAMERPANPTPQETALFVELAGNIERNAESQHLRSLWHLHMPSATDRLIDDTLPRWQRKLLKPYWMTLVLCLWLLVMSRRSLHEFWLRGWPIWAGLLAFSAWTRWTLPVDAPMTAWSWSRTTTLDDSVVPILDILRHIVADPLPPIATDTMPSIAARVVSVLTPLALLGHGRKLFGDARPALAAAFLLAASPHALRFAAADTQFNVSMFWSSVAFFWLYCALEAKSVGARALYAIGLAPLLVQAMTARPLNVAYGPLMIFALWIATSRDALRWRVTLALEVLAVFCWAVWDLLTSNSAGVQSVITFDSVVGAVELLARPDYNPVLFWRLTPPAWLPLIIIGAIALIWGHRPAGTTLFAAWKREAPATQATDPAKSEDSVTPLEPSVARRRGLWLVCWLVGYIALHGVVVLEEPMNNARYQLHSLPAMAMLAGVGLWAWWRSWGARGPIWRWSVIGVAAICLASPWLHRESIQDVGFATMQQRLFLKRWVEKALEGDQTIPMGCTVIEVKRAYASAPISKFERVGRLWLGADTTHVWQSIDVQRWAQHPLSNIGEPIETITPGVEDTSSQSAADATLSSSLFAAQGHHKELFPEFALLSDEGKRLLANPPSCLVFFESAECALAPRSREMHPACRDILASGPWEQVAELRTTSRLYDYPLIAHLRANGDPLELRLWRRVHTPRMP